MYSSGNISSSVWSLSNPPRRMSSHDPSGGQQLLRPPLHYAKVFLQWGEGSSSSVFSLTSEENLVEKYLFHRQSCTANRIKTIRGHKPQISCPLDEWQPAGRIEIECSREVKWRQHEDVKPVPVVSLNCAALNQDNKFNIHHKQQLESLSSLVACPYFWAIKAGYRLRWAVEPAHLIPAE